MLYEVITQAHAVALVVPTGLAVEAGEHLVPTLRWNAGAVVGHLDQHGHAGVSDRQQHVTASYNFV